MFKYALIVDSFPDLFHNWVGNEARSLLAAVEKNVSMRLQMRLHQW